MAPPKFGTTWPPWASSAALGKTEKEEEEVEDEEEEDEEVREDFSCMTRACARSRTHARTHTHGEAEEEGEEDRIAFEKVVKDGTVTAEEDLPRGPEVLCSPRARAEAARVQKNVRGEAEKVRTNMRRKKRKKKGKKFFEHTR